MHSWRAHLMNKLEFSYFQTVRQCTNFNEWAIVLSITRLRCIYFIKFATIWWGNRDWNKQPSIATFNFDFSHFFFLEQTFKEFNFNILLNLNSLATQILFNYISCYHANNLTLKSWSTSDIAYNTLWYTFPVDSQRSIMQMIQRSQKPFYLKGFGIVDCSLATFLNVRKKKICLFCSSFFRNWK